MTSKVEYWDGSSWTEIGYRNVKRVRSEMAFDELELQTTKKYLGDISAETEIRAMVEDQWVFAGKALNGGEMNRKGTLKIQGLSYGAFDLKGEVSISKDSTNTNISIMREIIENNVQYRDDTGTLNYYTLNAPSTEAIDLPGYTFNGKAKKAVKELQNKIKWTLWFEPDGNAYYRPIKYNSSGETIDTSTDNAIVSTYKPGDIDSVVSDVKVIGKDPNGNKVAYTASASSPDATNFERVKVDFELTDQNEAQAIAEQYLEPTATDTAVIYLPLSSWNGTTSTFDTYFNKTIDFKDQTRTNGTAETFFVAEEEITQGQLKLRLEKATKLKWGDKQSQKDEDLGSERAQQVTLSSREVGNQDSGTIDSGSGTANVGTSGGVSDNASDTSMSGNVDQDPSDTGVIGSVDKSGGASVIEEVGNWGLSYEIDQDTWTELGSFTTNAEHTQGMFINVTLSIAPQSTPSSGTVTLMHHLAIHDDDTNTDYPSDNNNGLEFGTVHKGITDLDGNDIWTWPHVSFTVFVPIDTYDTDFQINYLSKSADVSVNVDYTYWTIDEHNHGDNFHTSDNDHPHGDSFSTNDNDHPHGDNISASDSGHSDHPISGSTASKTINIGEGEKDDR